jgi:uncharacterized protein (TIGR04255 family)
MPMPLFDGPPPEEIKLPLAPLARVIGQVRFPTNLVLAQPDEVAGFQKAIRQAYPVLSRMEAPEMSVSPDGAVQVRSNPVWRFSDAANSWHASVSTAFVALETGAYTDRPEFLDRFSRVIEAAEAEFVPQIATRIGVRYVNRISGPSLGRLSTLVRPEILGLAAFQAETMLALSMTETQLSLPSGSTKMVLRHGLIPAQATYDPAALPIEEKPSWVLDIDVMKEGSFRFDTTELVETARSFSDYAYRLFRWTITDKFLEEFGASP